jgi:hypothetical protein
MRYPPPLIAREARVRPEYAHLYEAWNVRTWTPAAKVVEWVGGDPRADRRAERPPRMLPEDQFEFRGGAPRRPGLRARTRRTD